MSRFLLSSSRLKLVLTGVPKSLDMMLEGGASTASKRLIGKVIATSQELGFTTRTIIKLSLDGSTTYSVSLNFCVGNSAWTGAQAFYGRCELTIPATAIHSMIDHEAWVYPNRNNCEDHADDDSDQDSETK
ncbi:hypothetical protein TruAng_005327 [Truncatella angustata]|nr:hypothetical protein TruAng_005327 [Truncatella angustata]